MFKRFKQIILMLLLVIPISVYAYSDYIIASGKNIGIKLQTHGIIVAGNYDKTNTNIKKGDIIISLNDKDVTNLKAFMETISNSGEKTANIGYIRNGGYETATLNINNGKTGLYLKDSIAGIGTLTFIDPETLRYGALGHEIIDSNSGLILDNNGGNIYDSKIIEIKRSDNGNPGEKNASINTSSVLGDIDDNTNLGLFGDYDEKLDTTNLYKVGTSKDIKRGKAYMLTELEDNKVQKYAIEILKIVTKNEIKNIMFKVTDERLLEVGGIVQGMSGSPIIQNDYIVGAVTHVVVDNPQKGYGILITNMLKGADKKDD